MEVSQAEPLNAFECGRAEERERATGGDGGHGRKEQALTEGPLGNARILSQMPLILAMVFRIPEKPTIDDGERATPGWRTCRIFKPWQSGNSNRDGATRELAYDVGNGECLHWKTCRELKLARSGLGMDQSRRPPTFKALASGVFTGGVVPASIATSLLLMPALTKAWFTGWRPCEEHLGPRDS
ncbi:hypothetical protein VNO77_42061 [Canavalia gladiata]|uniref:Uncharacterized protein n=1 Tax=Canavalia gladiata TaxID=3824 RepID=A0AAN9JZJ8_CANGL